MIKKINFVDKVYNAWNKNKKYSRFNYNKLQKVSLALLLIHALPIHYIYTPQCKAKGWYLWKIIGHKIDLILAFSGFCFVFLLSPSFDMHKILNLYIDFSGYLPIEVDLVVFRFGQLQLQRSLTSKYCTNIHFQFPNLNIPVWLVQSKFSFDLKFTSLYPWKIHATAFEYNMYVLVPFPVAMTNYQTKSIFTDKIFLFCFVFFTSKL